MGSQVLLDYLVPGLGALLAAALHVVEAALGERLGAGGRRVGLSEQHLGQLQLQIALSSRVLRLNAALEVRE